LVYFIVYLHGNFFKNMTLRLFLDDNRSPYDVFTKTIDPDYEHNNEWSIVTNFYEFVNFIEKFGVPNLISFDHDLTQEHYLHENQSNINYELFNVPTGYHAAKWLLNYCLKNNKKIPTIKVHSANQEGKRNIEEIFTSQPQRLAI